MNKCIGISLGTVVGISHIGMIGMLANRTSFPKLDLPITEYTSYSVRAGKDGYAINYRANDPLRLGVRKSVERPAGFLGFGKARTSFEEQYTMDGSRHVTGSINGKDQCRQRTVYQGGRWRRIDGKDCGR